jgi:hypothetical protein
MAMQITYTYEGQQQTIDLAQTEVFIGRPNPHLMPHLDLSPDGTVSRTHARLWVEEGNYWIEDLASKFGTFVNGVKLDHPRQLHPGDRIRIGETELQVLVAPHAPGASAAPPAALAAPEGKVETALDVESGHLLAVAAAPGHTKERLALLLELPLQFGAQGSLDELLRVIIERVVQVIPGAERGALLLRNPDNDQLELKASVPPDKRAFSETLARRALNEGRALIWRKIIDGVVSESIRRLEMKTGMYAPMLWKNKALGVICVDNPRRDSRFSEDDLRLLLAVANYAAMAVANYQYARK